MGVTFQLPLELTALREEAKKGRDPTCADETLSLLIEQAQACKAEKILEIGAAEGLTSIALSLALGAAVIAIEKDALRLSRARENALRFGADVHWIEGDAAEILPLLSGPFDLIFLDGPKVQYRTYFPHCKRLLQKGGYLFSDDVLLYGWVLGEAPPKRRMLAQHLREYLDMLSSDPDFSTRLYPFGEGLAVSQKQA